MKEIQQRTYNISNQDQKGTYIKSLVYDKDKNQ